MSRSDRREGRCKHFIAVSYYVIARSDYFCRAVAIPRKGSVRLQLFVEMTELQVADIEPFSTSALAAVPPQRRYPDRPPLMVKDTLLVVAVDVDFVVIQ